MQTMTTNKWPLSVEFHEVKTICGAAGGIDRKAVVTVQVTGLSDTVEAVRLLLAAAPELKAALYWSLRQFDHNSTAPCFSHKLAEAFAALSKAEGK